MYTLDVYIFTAAMCVNRAIGPAWNFTIHHLAHLTLYNNNVLVEKHSTSVYVVVWRNAKRQPVQNISMASRLTHNSFLSVFLVQFFFFSFHLALLSLKLEKGTVALISCIIYCFNMKYILLPMCGCVAEVETDTFIQTTDTPLVHELHFKMLPHRLRLPVRGQKRRMQRKR